MLSVLKVGATKRIGAVRPKGLWC